MIDFDVAYDKLSQFESASEIGQFFIDQEVQGTPGDSSYCAIAVWLTQTTEKTVRVTGSEISNRSDLRDYPLTKPMFNFIEQFDNEDWPQLIETD